MPTLSFPREPGEKRGEAALSDVKLRINIGHPLHPPTEVLNQGFGINPL
jgi:hypothetical protein